MGNVSQRCLRAFEDGQEEVARKLLPTVPHPQSLTDSDNWTLLHWAAVHGWHDMCRLLVEQYNVCPTYKDVFGWSPLHLTIEIHRSFRVCTLVEEPKDR